MKYVQPVGAVGPVNAFGNDYVDKNAGAGVAGSFVAADAVEHPLIEIVSLIAKSGLAPSASDLQQLLRAVRSQRMNYVAAPTGSANALTITLDPAPDAWADLVGMPLRLLIGAANTASGVTLSPNGLAAKAIVYNDGTALQAGDLTGLVEVAYNATLDKVQILGFSRVASLNVKRSQLVAERGASSQLTGDAVITRVTGYGAVTSSFQGGTTFAAGVLTIGAADAGLWFVAGHCRQTSPNGSGQAVYLYRNNSQILASDGGPAVTAGSIIHSNAARVVQLAGGDTLDMRLVQTSGADFTFNDIYSFSAVRLGA